MGPVLINEVFAINDDVHIEQIGDCIIIDNLFKDYVKIREAFIDAPAFNWKIPKGTRNFIDYYDCRHFFSHYEGFPFTDCIRKIIEHVWSRDTQLQRHGIRTNWFKQINPKISDWSEVHIDASHKGEYTMITTLNTLEECSGGTSLFTDLDHIDGHKGLTYWSKLKNHGTPLNIEMKPGRTIIFPSEIPHAAWHPIDSFYDFPRLNMVCRFTPP